ncbi:MAG: hypothetical protein ACJA2E_000075 [Arenicella sp.]|jgi:hypothetical protein
MLSTKSVLPNFLKTLLITSMAFGSVAAYAGHHLEGEKKVGDMKEMKADKMHKEHDAKHEMTKEMHKEHDAKHKMTKEMHKEHDAKHEMSDEAAKGMMDAEEKTAPEE